MHFDGKSYFATESIISSSRPVGSMLNSTYEDPKLKK